MRSTRDAMAVLDTLYSERRKNFITFARVHVRVDESGGRMVECVSLHRACSFRIPPVLKSFLTPMDTATIASLQHHESSTT